MNFKACIVFIIGFSFLALSSWAQESSYSEEHENKTYQSKEIFPLTGTARNSVQPATTDVARQESNTSDDSGDVEVDEEDVLSFNFLYYIIQRYKMSDLVEEKK